MEPLAEGEASTAPVEHCVHFPAPEPTHWEQESWHAAHTGCRSMVWVQDRARYLPLVHVSLQGTQEKPAPAGVSTSPVGHWEQLLGPEPTH